RVTDDFRDLPPGPHRLPLLAFVAEALAEMRERHEIDDGWIEQQRHAVYARMSEHTARGVLLGWPVAYLGSKERFLGLVAPAHATARPHPDAAARAEGQPRPAGGRAQLARARVLESAGAVDAARRVASRCARHAATLGMRRVAEQARAIA